MLYCRWSMGQGFACRAVLRSLRAMPFQVDKNQQTICTFATSREYWKGKSGGIFLQRHGKTGRVGSRPQSLRRRMASPELRKWVSAILACLALCISGLMPLTEVAYASDGFILSGHDSELSALAFVLFVGLVVLLANRAHCGPLVWLTGLCCQMASSRSSRMPAFVLDGLVSQRALLAPLVPLRI